MLVDILNILKDLNHYISFLCELYSLVKDKSVPTSSKIAYITSGTFLSENMFVYMVLYPSPESALQPRGMRNVLDEMERFVIRELEEIDNFLGKQTLKSKATVYSNMTLQWEVRKS